MFLLLHYSVDQGRKSNQKEPILEPKNLKNNGNKILSFNDTYFYIMCVHTAR